MPEAPNTSLIDHADELAAGALKRLRRAVALGRQVAHHRLTMAHQVPQYLDLRGRHEAGAHRAATDRVGDPPRILHVRLAAGHVTHVRGVADDEGESTFQSRGIGCQ